MYVKTLLHDDPLQDQLPAFLKTAEKLKIKGLAEGEQGKDDAMS